MKNKWIKALSTAIILTTVTNPSLVSAETIKVPYRTTFVDMEQISEEKQAAIVEAARQGLLTGDEKGMFRPVDALTRQELAVLLARSLQLDTQAAPSNTRLEAGTGEWALPYIEAVRKAGLMIGDGKGNFHPKDPVSREELAAIFVRAVNGEGTHGGNAVVVNDIGSTSAWAKDMVSSAVRLGLIDAQQDGAFQPKAIVQRQDIAAFLLDIFQSKVQQATITRVDGDVVIIDDKPHLITPALKRLIGDNNADVLVGAVLTFKSKNRSLNDLEELEIVQSGSGDKPVVLDLSGTSFGGVLRVSGTHVTIKGDGNTRIERLEPMDNALDLQLTNVIVETLVLSNNVAPSDIIRNYNEIKAQFGQVIGGKKEAPAPTTPVTNVPPPVNHAPVVNLDWSVSPMTVGLNAAIDLSSLFTDEDGDTLSYTITALSSSIATVASGGTTSMPTIHPVASGTANFKVDVSDGKGHVVSTFFNVTVMNVPNQPPVGIDIPDQSLESGTSAKQIDLSLYFSDPEHEVLTYTATVQNGALATAVVSGDKLNITPVAEGITTIEVMATDPKGATASKTIALTVTPANKPPIGLDIPDQSLEAGTSAKEIDLSSYFSDPEHEVLTYTTTVQNGALATASVTGDKLSITPLAEGATTINVTAMDSKGATASKTIALTVTPANKPPVGLNIPDQSLESGTSAKQIDLSLYFSDPENEMLTYTATVQNGALATASVTGDKLSITPVAEGITTIEVAATDPKGAYTSRTVNLTVTAASVTPPADNKPPSVVASIQTQLLSPGYTNPRTYDLSQLFEDPEGDAMTYTAVVSDPGVALATVNGSVITLSPGTAGHTGSVTVTITASDSNGGSTTYNLTVLSVQLVDKGFVEITTKVGVPSLTYDLKSLFPGQTNFNVYFATPDQTLTSPTPLSGTVWTGTPMNVDYWIVGADNKAVLLRVNVEAQVSGEAYFAQYIDGGYYNKTFQIRNPFFGTAQRFTGYSIEVYHYNPGTNTITSATTDVFQMPVQNIMDLEYVNVIDRAFYDYFDLINTPYYNIELNLNDPGKNMIAIVLKHNGTVVDVLGDPTSHDEFMPNGGTIIRKAAIFSGSAKFSETGEWNVYAKGTYQYYNQRTP
ncbi:MAG: S-layer homology domain-containing protein [Candidatus Cohnella colombiensis]|uniref:S-layer homology domain-containing protein n=1 Tax=Candidatus Cohnella colombiensis TaxID=3121368 RepID=A0AA95JBR3_9BACL|nr:MAG: S-layer homology domain-containing protein [Cohnella sp.]